MSQWGKLDYKELLGTAAVVQGAANVTATIGSFTTANVKPGDSLLISNVAYRVEAINSSNTLTLSNAYTAATGAGKALAVQESPKDLSTYGQNANVTYDFMVSKRNVYGVDRIEADNPDTKAKGINHPGWVHYKTWTNTQGSTRHRAETLVAMSKNFNSNAAITLQIDAPDDTQVPDYGAEVLSGPTLVTQGTYDGTAAVYTATGRASGGGTASYSWQYSPNNIVWVDLLNNDGPLNTGNTTTTLTLANVYATPDVVGGYVRVVIGNSLGAATATSDALQITGSGL